ncbi:MAG: AEC family transporter [Spirochaetes bacterium]|nr:AEC family transporter [Spirochaetota bacterium]
MQTEIVISQIFILGVVVLIGAISAKLKILTPESKDMLSKVIFNITLPLMLFTKFLRLETTPVLIKNSLIVFMISVLVILFLYFVSLLTAKLFRIKGAESAVFKIHSMFGNTVFLGFPLINTLYGEEGLLYAGIFQLVSSVTTWTMGVMILTHSSGTSLKEKLLNIINPNTIAMILGLLLAVLSVRLPDVLVKPMAELGSANTWLSMLYIGTILYFAKVSRLLKNKSIYLVTFNRLILAPLLLITLFNVTGSLTGILPDKLVLSVIILEASMPCMASIVIIAKELGSDVHLAAGNIFVSTILSILTLPFAVMAINYWL